MAKSGFASLYLRSLNLKSKHVYPIFFQHIQIREDIQKKTVDTMYI